MTNFRRKHRRRQVALVVAIGIPAVAMALVLKLCCGVLISSANSQAAGVTCAEMVAK